LLATKQLEMLLLCNFFPFSSLLSFCLVSLTFAILIILVNFEFYAWQIMYDKTLNYVSLVKIDGKLDGEK